MQCRAGAPPTPCVMGRGRCQRWDEAAKSLKGRGDVSEPGFAGLLEKNLLEPRGWMGPFDPASSWRARRWPATGRAASGPVCCREQHVLVCSYGKKRRNK